MIIIYWKNYDKWFLKPGTMKYESSSPFLFGATRRRGSWVDSHLLGLITVKLFISPWSIFFFFGWHTSLRLWSMLIFLLQTTPPSSKVLTSLATTFFLSFKKCQNHWLVDSRIITLYPCITFWSRDLFSGKLTQMGGSWWVTQPHSHQLLWNDERKKLGLPTPTFLSKTKDTHPRLYFCNNFVNFPQFLSINEKL